MKDNANTFYALLVSTDEHPPQNTVTCIYYLYFLCNICQNMSTAMVTQMLPTPRQHPRGERGAQRPCEITDINKEQWDTCAQS